MPTLTPPLADVVAGQLANPALVYIGTACIGGTRGGTQWDPGKTYAPIAVDGVRNPHVQGMERIASYDAKITLTLLQAAEADLLRLEPGATSATGTAPVSKVISMKAAGELLDTGDYDVDVRVVWPLEDGTFVAIYMPLALVGKSSMAGAADGEATIPIEIWGATTQAAPNACPFKYELRTALPA